MMCCKRERDIVLQNITMTIYSYMETRQRTFGLRELHFEKYNDNDKSPVQSNPFEQVQNKDKTSHNRELVASTNQLYSFNKRNRKLSF